MKKRNFWLLSLILISGLSIASCGGGSDEETVEPTPSPSESRKNPSVSLSNTSAPTSFTTKLLLEDYTGTWCGYCPRVAHSMEEAIKKNSNIIGVGVHDDNELGFTHVESMLQSFNIKSFPTAMINRSSKWIERYNELEAVLSKASDLGIALQTSVKDNSVSGTIQIGFKSDITKSIDYVIYLVEDKVQADQRNYYNGDSSSPFYGLGDPIKNYEHANVLRKTATDVFGNIIPEDYTKKGNICEANFEITLGNYNQANCYIIAFVVEKGGKNVMNAQIVKIGSNKDFD